MTTEIPEDIMKAARECARQSVERPYNQKSTERAAQSIARALLAERERNETRIHELEAQVASWIETVNRQEKAIAAAADQHAGAIQRERQRCAAIAATFNPVDKAIVPAQLGIASEILGERGRAKVECIKIALDVAKSFKVDGSHSTSHNESKRAGAEAVAVAILKGAPNDH